MQLNIKIGGMTCAGCVSSIENSVRKIKGVKDVRVDLEEQKATVIYDGRNEVIKDIVSAISSRGYYVIPEKLIIFTDLVNSDIKREIEKIEGVISVQTFIDEIEISYISQNPEKILSDVRKLGVRVLRYVKGGDGDSIQSDLDIKALRRDFLVSLPPAIYFLVRMFFHHLDYLKYVDFLVCSYVIPLAYSRFGRGFFKKLISFSSDMNVLVSLGVFSSYIFSVIETFFHNFLPGNFLFYESSAIITSVVLLGRYIEISVRKKGYGVLRKIVEMEPQYAAVLEDGKEVRKSISELRQGDLVIVREGSRVPADGNILKGRMKLDESHITGEVQPVVKNQGERVFCGSLVFEGWALVEVVNTGEDTVLRKMIRAIRESRFKKTSFERLSDKISAFFVPFVILISLLSFVFWLFYADFAFAVERSISVLVVACPCALGLATPTALLSAVVKSAGFNIVVRNASTFELIPMSRNVAFDKTGTLTEGKLRIKDVVICDESYDLKNFVELVASAESVSEHKIAQALVNYSLEIGCSIKPPESFFSLKGKGIWAKVGDTEIIIGNEKILKDFGLEVPDINLQDGYSHIYVFLQRKFAGVITVEETINQFSYKVVEFLRERGKDIYLITGDSLESANKVAVSLGIDKIFAGVLPDEKVKVISEIKKKGYTVMVGDGINDAPALSSADVGVAVNYASEISKISSDVVVPSLKLLPALFELSDYVVRTIKMNLFWAFLYNVILIPIAAGVLYKFGIFINPILSALAMSFSSIFVVVNSLTVLSKRFGE